MPLEIVDIRNYQTLLDATQEIPLDGKEVLFINTRTSSRESFLTHLRRAKGLVTDFGGTLCIGDQWEHLRALMTEEGRADELKDLAGYYAAGRHRTSHDDMTFIFRSADRLAQARVRRNAIWSAAEKAKQRCGAHELLRTFADGRAAVVSYGLADYINGWWTYHNLPDLLAVQIHALRLKWTSSEANPWQICIGYDAPTVVTEHNKDLARDIFRASRQFAKAEILVLGDSPTDVRMMDQDHLGVLLLPGADPDKQRARFREIGLQELWPRVSAVLAGDSLLPLVRLRNST